MIFSYIKTRYNLVINRRRLLRRLEIGPGDQRIPGFETLNITDGSHVDYVVDAARPLPFPDNCFELIYASHILEHIPWYKTELVVREWVRILRPGGCLEVWVPDGLKICKAFVDAENGGPNVIHMDGWYKFNPTKDVCVWACGRIFTYGDGTGSVNSPNWHRALFSQRYLSELFVKVGLVSVEPMTGSAVRGNDHGWINLGLKGIKECTFGR